MILLSLSVYVPFSLIFLWKEMNLNYASIAPSRSHLFSLDFTLFVLRLEITNIIVFLLCAPPMRSTYTLCLCALSLTVFSVALMVRIANTSDSISLKVITFTCVSNWAISHIPRHARSHFGSSLFIHFVLSAAFAPSPPFVPSYDP